MFCESAKAEEYYIILLRVPMSDTTLLDAITASPAEPSEKDVAIAKDGNRESGGISDLMLQYADRHYHDYGKDDDQDDSLAYRRFMPPDLGSSITR
jgi:hypothetical protein